MREAKVPSADQKAHEEIEASLSKNDGRKVNNDLLNEEKNATEDRQDKNNYPPNHPDYFKLVKSIHQYKNEIWADIKNLQESTQ